MVSYVFVLYMMSPWAKLLVWVGGFGFPMNPTFRSTRKHKKTWSPWKTINEKTQTFNTVTELARNMSCCLSLSLTVPYDLYNLWLSITATRYLTTPHSWSLRLMTSQYFLLLLTPLTTYSSLLFLRASYLFPVEKLETCVTLVAKYWALNICIYIYIFLHIYIYIYICTFPGMVTEPASFYAPYESWLSTCILDDFDHQKRTETQVVEFYLDFEWYVYVPFKLSFFF